MARLMLLGVLLFAGRPLSGQQLSLYTLYRDNLQLLNPAALTDQYILYEQPFTVGAAYRQQWAGVEGAPGNLSARFNWVSPGSPVAARVHLLNDRTGAIGLTGIYGGFAYRLVSRGHTLALGLGGGLVQYRVNMSEISFRVTPTGLPGQGNLVQWYPDFSFGAFYYYRESFYAGVSVPQILQLSPTLGDEEERFRLDRSRHYFAVMGTYLYVGGGEASFLEPSAWVRYVEGAPLSVDINLRYQFNDAFWVGFGGSSARAVHFETGVWVGGNGGLGGDGRFKLGFGYDYFFNGLGPQLGSTLEANVSYAWGR